MKALSHIAVLMFLVLSSCAPAVYTGAEYDDLYYSASDKPQVKQSAVVNDQVAEKELKANNYYDNVYAADTLVTDKYSVPSDYDDQIVVNNSNAGGSGYDYYDDSYSNRINMFYGNYFNPYWQDPYYFNVGFNYGYPYIGFGMNFGYGFGIGFGFGYPYYGYGYPYYGYGGYPYYDYGYPYYGGYYGCCYPYYGGGYYHSDDYYTSYGRRERPSSLSSNYNDNLGTAGSGRRNTDGTTGGYSAAGRRTSSTSQLATTDARRSASGITSGSAVKSGQDAVKSENAASRSASSSQRTVVNSRPEYKSANRSYTPSYNNPRMSTKPSYNNSRVSDRSGSVTRQNNSSVNQGRTFNSTAPVRNSTSRVINQGSGSSQKSSSFSNMQRRYSSPSSSSSKQYSVPSKSNSGGSRSSFSSGGSSGRSSYSGGSSSGGSRSSFSSGSSSGSSGRSSSSSHSSGGRR